MSIRKKNIFISASSEKERIKFLKAIANLAFANIEQTKLYLIDPEYSHKEWQIDSNNRDCTVYAEYEPQPRFNGIKDDSILDALCLLKDCVEDRAKGVIKAKRLGKNSSDRLSALWIINNAELLAKKYPYTPSSRENNAVKPIIYMLKLGHLVEDMMIVSGKSPCLQEYGISRADFMNFDVAIWLGEDNIQKGINEVSNNILSRIKQLREELKTLTEQNLTDEYIALVKIRGEEPFITTMSFSCISLDFSKIYEQKKEKYLSPILG
ncbi:MAG: hypothetical protein F6K08_00140 [Okeania sp. SIO1H6]|nr:hypothetical protein [Okeania sp. SIO1H6]